MGELAMEEDDGSTLSIFLCLPNEILLKIVKYALPRDVIAIVCVCAALRELICKDESVWREMYLVKWGAFPLPRKRVLENSSWRQLYFQTKVWDLGNFGTLRTLSPHSRGVTSLCVDEKYLFSGSHDNSIQISSIDSLQVVKTLHGHKYTIWALVSDGDTLYSGSNDHTIAVWNLNTFSEVGRLTAHASKIFGLKIKDKALFSSGDSIIKVWNRTTLKPVHTLEGHTGGINAMCVEGSHLLSGSSDKTLRLWDINTLEPLRVMTDSAKILSIAATENMFFTGLQDCMIKAWDARTYACVMSGYSHNWEVWQLALAGGYLFSGSFDHNIKVWDFRTSFHCVTTLNGHRSYIHALTADTQRLFSGSADKTIRVWGEKPSTISDS